MDIFEGKKNPSLLLPTSLKIVERYQNFFVTFQWGNGRRFIDGDVSLGDKLPNLLSETYALVKKGNYRKYIDGILYISFVRITPNVCLKSWKLRKITKILQNLSKWDIIS